jgi:hypothetical protein
MSEWCWLALVDEPVREPEAWARATAADGSPAGVLAAWLRRVKPVRDARRAWTAIIDPDGREATVSLVRPPPGVRLLFDDLAVQEARRRVLAGLRFDAVSTLLSDASHFEGAITVARGADQVARLADDPFASIFPARVLRVGPGLLGAVAPPAGPCIERYGSAHPWPADRFDGGAVTPPAGRGRGAGPARTA